MLKGHKLNCQCFICKTIRGEYKGKNNQMYGRRHTSTAKEKNRQANSGDKNGMWIDGRDWYKSRHSWIIRIKGKASNYKCVDCNNSAIEWSNKDHKYSDDPDDYDARCRGCHLKHDYMFNNRTRR